MAEQDEMKQVVFPADKGKISKIEEESTLNQISPAQALITHPQVKFLTCTS